MKKKILFVFFLTILIISSTCAAENKVASALAYTNDGNSNIFITYCCWFLHSCSAVCGVIGLVFGMAIYCLDKAFVHKQ